MPASKKSTYVVVNYTCDDRRKTPRFISFQQFDGQDKTTTNNKQEAYKLKRFMQVNYPYNFYEVYKIEKI